MFVNKVKKYGRYKFTTDEILANRQDFDGDKGATKFPGNLETGELVTFYNGLQVSTWDALEITLLNKKNSNSIYVSAQCGYEVVCRTNFNLQKFPYDINQMKMEIRLKENDAIVYDLQMFYLELHKSCSELLEYSLLFPEVKRESTRQSNICIKVKRKASYWLFGVWFINVILTVLLLLVYLVDVNDVADRLAVTLSILLSVVAFRVYVSSELPRLSYLTVFDYYINITIGLVAFIAVGSAIPSHLSNDENSIEKIDIAAVVASAGVVGAINAIAIIHFWGLHMLGGSRLEMENKNWQSFQYGAKPDFN